MTPKEYIIDTLTKLTSEFNNIRCRYENDFISNTHFVEVVPRDVLESNEQFKTSEEKIMVEFISLFPDQNLCFLSDDALVGLDTIDFEIKGVLYDVFYSFNQHFYKVLNDCKLDIKPSLVSFSNIIGHPNNIRSEISPNLYSKSISNTEWGSINSIIAIETCKPTEIPCEYTYAIAA
jgi:hypothetical protein